MSVEICGLVRTLLLEAELQAGSAGPPTTLLGNSSLFNQPELLLLLTHRNTDQDSRKATHRIMKIIINKTFKIPLELMRTGEILDSS